MSLLPSQQITAKKKLKTKQPNFFKQGIRPKEMLYYNSYKVCGNVQCIYNYSMNSHFKDKQYLTAFGNIIFPSCWTLSNTRKLCVKLIPVTKHSEICKYIRSEMFSMNSLTTQQPTLDPSLWLPFSLFITLTSPLS